MNAYRPGTDWTMDLLRTAETVATLETPKERARATLEALIAAEGRGAKLAAAPEMLEALRVLAEEAYAPDARCCCRNIPMPPCNDCVEYGALRDALTAAKAAIAKAEGRQS